mmetsp:Transcript_110929/g.237015  ORF Transcript_110929/g.237015 Transcript_110929/m.237015 type:complete len:82 (+) Transcript_110929:1126-1371(+)
MSASRLHLPLWQQSTSQSYQTAWRIMIQHQMKQRRTKQPPGEPKAKSQQEQGEPCFREQMGAKCSLSCPRTPKLFFCVVVW